MVANEQVQMLAVFETRVGAMKEEELQLVKQAHEAVILPTTHIQLYGLLIGGITLVSQTQGGSSPILFGAIFLLLIGFLVGTIVPFLVAYTMITKLSSKMKDLRTRYKLLGREVALFSDEYKNVKAGNVNEEGRDIEQGSDTGDRGVGALTDEIQEIQETKSKVRSMKSLNNIFSSLDEEMLVDVEDFNQFRTYYVRLLILQGVSAFIFAISIPLITSFLWKSYLAGFFVDHLQMAS